MEKYRKQELQRVRDKLEALCCLIEKCEYRPAQRALRILRNDLTTLQLGCDYYARLEEEFGEE